MRNIIRISSLIIYIFLFSCKHPNAQKNLSDIEVISDTITVNIKGSLEQAVKYKNKYYCFFSEEKPYTSKGELHFYILLENGNIEKSVFVPEEMQNLYLDLHIRNDSIISKDYYDHKTYFLDPIKLEWIEVDKVDDLVFEDENYYVTYLDFGEWGGTLWFKDKKTGKEYEIASSRPTLNKIKGIYYVTSSKQVLAIEDPSRMKMCEPKSMYENVVREDFHNGSQALMGTKALFVDSTLQTRSGFYISTSFVHENRLINLCVDSSNVFLAEIVNSKMIPIDTIGHNIRTTRNYNTYRQNLDKNNLQLLQFETTKNIFLGFIEINRNEISLHYINNEDAVKYLGNQTADIAFNALFKYIINNKGNLNLTQIDSVEQKFKGTDATPRHKMTIGKDFYPNKSNFIIESPKVYKKIEDTTLTLLTNYYYTKQEGSIKVFSFEWRETHENNYGIYASENEEYKSIQFNVRFEKIKESINSTLGKPKNIKKELHGHELTWLTETGMVIILSNYDYNNYRQILMRMYKE